MLLFTGLTVSLAILPSVWSANIQKPGLTVPDEYQVHRDTVVEIFKDSYDTYRKYAWGHDDVSPLTQTGNDDLNGWGATIIDAMPTAFVMGLMDYFDEGLEFVGSIDYGISQTDGSVSLFETTIRHLGGLISAYELSGQQHDIFIQKAVEIADKMAYGWVNGSDIPYGHLIFERDAPSKPVDLEANSNIAEAGTLALEWGLLSKYSGNKTYNELAQSALRRIIKNPAPLPGMPSQVIDPATGDAVNGYVTWGGGSDSYFEYLSKYARLTNTDDNSYMDTWHRAIDTTLTTLLRRTTIGNWLYTADQDSKERIRHVGSHLACFNGGNFIMGGKMLNNETIVDVGLELTDSCFNTYLGTPSGIGPEGFAYVSEDGDFTGGNPLTDEQLKFYDEKGFYVTSGYYILRPEVLESNFYAWRSTGDTKYLDRAVTAIESFKEWLHASNTVEGATGYVGIVNVNSPAQEQFDDTPSFWFSEVLKYLYLTFDDPEHMSLDDYVFNTECHPFKAPQPKDMYGSGAPAPLSTKAFRVQGGVTPIVSPVSYTPPQVSDNIS